MVEIAASADPDGYLEPPPSEPSRRLSARPAPERTGSPDGLQTRSSAEPYYSLKSRQAPVRSRPRTPDPAEPSPRPPARVGRSRERPLSNPPSNRMSPLLRCGGPPTAPASRVAISPVSPPEHQRAAALPVPASAPTDRQSDIADLSRRSAKERIRIRLGAVWYSFRHLLQILVTAAFVVLGIVALALVGRLAIMVSQGLNTPESEMVNQQRVDERLPTEDADSVSADALAKKLMPSTGDAFLVVLSMHPDAATAQHTFAEMRQTMGATLTDLKPDIQPVETPNGIRYRLALASPMSRERAFAMCSDFKAAGFHACWLRRLQR